MQHSYCLMLKFYKNNAIVASRCMEALQFGDIYESFDIADYDKCIISGYYRCPCDFSDSDGEENSSSEVEHFV